MTHDTPDDDIDRAIAARKRVDEADQMTELHGLLSDRLLTRSALDKLPPVEDRIAQVMSHPAAVVVVGPPGVGKSLMVMGMAGSLATGQPWLGLQTSLCKTLWVVGEAPNGLNRRITAWEQHFNGGEPIRDERLRFLIKPHDLHTPQAWADLAATARAADVGLVVLDTLSSLYPGADETRDAGQVIRRMSDVAHTCNASVVLIHHTGWADKSRARGGSQFEADADEVLLVTPVSENTFTLTRKKVKDDERGEPMWLRRVPVGDSVVVTGGSRAEADLPVRELLLAVLTATGDAWSSVSQLLAEMPEVARSTAYWNLKALVADKHVERGGTEKRQVFRLAKRSS